MASFRVIILEKAAGGSVAYRYALWALVNAPARQPFYANPQKTSAFKDIEAQDLTDLRAGLFVERVEVFSSASALTLGQVRAELEARWTAFQAEVDTHNPWDRYGSTWNGTIWAANGAS